MGSVYASTVDHQSVEREKLVSNSTRHDEFVLLITNVQARLYAYVFSLLGDPHQAADVLQETNLVLWRKSAEYIEGTDFVAWARRTAYFQVLAFRKNVGREHLIFDDLIVAELASQTASRSEMFSVRLNALNDCMKRLSERQRELLSCHYTDGQSIHDIAVTRGETIGAIAQALFRARIALLKCIEQNTEQNEN
jgi:RNA polymerase sigma-70 factor, ECF subfamily